MVALLLKQRIWAWALLASPTYGQNGNTTAPDARPSCAVIARILEQSLWVVASVRGNGIFAAETKPPKPFH